MHARVWAPVRDSVEFVHLTGSGEKRHPLRREPTGHFSGLIAGANPGDRYWFALDGDRLRADPCSRYQPEGPHGPSEIVDPDAFRWTDSAWTGAGAEGHVLYELHVGTFTPEGTWRSAMEQFPALARLGITALELMPVNEFAGSRGWGYDGVALYAPTRAYGTPDDLRRFVDRAHALGLAVLLDVVYNHLGPDGKDLADFSPEYFTDKYENDWGKAINFEGPASAREHFIANAGYWIDEFHFDGLRVDATQDMHDASDEHVLVSITERARSAAEPRRVLIIAENEPQDAKLLRTRAQGGFGMDAAWNDDFHHAAVVALTGRREAYYQDYKGTAQELVASAKYGFLYQGQYYTWQKKRRGTPALDIPHHAFVVYLENHDQVANSAFGRRLHQVSAPGRLRAMTALLLLVPGTPMLFQGQEFASSAPFLYFADHKDELREPITNGRREFLGQFLSLRDPEVLAALAPPMDEETFMRSKLDPAERERNVEAVALHTDLIAIKRGDPVIGRSETRVDGSAVSPELLVLRYFGGVAGDRLLVVNLGCDIELAPISEPLLAPPAGAWTLSWSSEFVRYGGNGTPTIYEDGRWRLPGEAAVLMTSGQGARE